MAENPECVVHSCPEFAIFRYGALYLPEEFAEPHASGALIGAVQVLGVGAGLLVDQRASLSDAAAPAAITIAPVIYTAKSWPAGKGQLSHLQSTDNGRTTVEYHV